MPTRNVLYCPSCRQSLDEENFYQSYNKEKHPNGYLSTCKKCTTMGVDNFDPETFKPILEDIDIPYVQEEWMSMAHRYCDGRDPRKISGTTVLGRYISKMRLKKWREYTYKDSDLLEQQARERAETALKSSGCSEEEIKEIMEDRNKIERPVAPKGANEETPTAAPVSQVPVSEYFTQTLTPEDRKYLTLQWGSNYNEEEWMRLEKLYQEMMSSYDINTAGHIDTLKMICKTSLKMNELIDMNDIEGFQKMSRAYDALMKSGKFTAVQNKTASNNYVDSISELVELCERDGFIPRYYKGDEVNDKVDMVLKDTKNYIKNLVEGESNLGEFVERALDEYNTSENNTVEDEEEDEESKEEAEIEKQIENLYDHGSTSADTMTDEDLIDFNEFLEEQRDSDQESLKST